MIDDRPNFFPNKFTSVLRELFQSGGRIGLSYLNQTHKDGRNDDCVVSWEDRPHLRRSIQLSLSLLSNSLLGQTNHADFF